MARAYGWNVRLLLGFETTYGEAPLAGSFMKVPFISSTLDSEQGLLETSVLGLGRDPTAPFQDVINVEGDLVVPADLRNIGYWLKGAFGVPVSVGAGPYTHDFESGGISLPSLSLELGMPEVPDFPLFAGVRVNSMAFNFQRSGEAQVTLGLIGQGEIAAAATRDAAPGEAIYTRFSQFQGSIKQGGADLGDVTTASITYSNNLEKVETIRDDGMVAAIEPGMSSLSGSITVRYSDTTLMDAARAGTPIDLELSYTIDANQKLQIIAHEVYLPKPKRSVSGPGGIEATYDFQGAKDDVLGKMLTITLTNDMTDYN